LTKWRSRNDNAVPARVMLAGRRSLGPAAEPVSNMDSHGSSTPGRDAIAAKLLDTLNAAGYSHIRCTLPDHEQPEAVRWREGEAGHVPHFTARKSGRAYLFEIALRADFAKLATEERWRLFSYSAQESGALFIIVVDAADKAPAEAEVRRLRISARVMGSARD
jgi:hypothetical protein